MRVVRLNDDFFAKNTLWVAKNLLGKFLCRRLKSGLVIKSMITETEAYRGFNDKASHAFRGRTRRTEVMFGYAGTIYVYLVYGMHHCLNIVTEKKDYPAAVLIRGVENASGPGRVCKLFSISRDLNGKKLGKELWIEEKENQKSQLRLSYTNGYGAAKQGFDGQAKIPPALLRKAQRAGKYQKSKRIGIDYSGKSKNKLWRFVIK